MIETSLERIEEGTYGQCEECGVKIPKSRLNAIPYATLCVRCAEFAGTTPLKPAVPLSRYLLFFAIAIGGCAVDLASKTWMFAHLRMPGPDGETWWLWKGVFGFQTSLNEGALFGIGQGFSMVFAGLSVITVLGIAVWLFWFGAAHDRLLTVALAVVSIGILGQPLRSARAAAARLERCVSEPFAGRTRLCRARFHFGDDWQLAYGRRSTSPTLRSIAARRCWCGMRYGPNRNLKSRLRFVNLRSSAAFPIKQLSDFAASRLGPDFRLGTGEEITEGT